VEIESVSERVELVNTDARDLPFPPESFDVVLSNLALSNIPRSEGRTKAVHEAIRVFRPGGQTRVVDDRADRYAPVLQSAGGRGRASGCWQSGGRESPVGSDPRLDLRQ
jgi:arsenite methyltransferase